MSRSSSFSALRLTEEPGGGPAGIWAMDDASLVPIETFDAGPAIVLVLTEAVLLLAADLPLAGARARVQALPFAIEDRIAQPLAEVHVALGEELAPQRHLAGVVAHARMAGWVERLAEAGLAHAAIVPDALMLPVPDAGFWAVDRVGERVRVRIEDGTGFALPFDHLAHAWAAAGRPRCLSYGEPLPDLFGATATRPGGTALAERLAAPALDLRGGAYGRPRRALAPLWRRVAAVAAIGVLAHGAIAAADTAALHHIASRHDAATRALIQAAAPAAALGDDLSAGVADLLPESGTGPSSFLPLLVRVAGALKQLGPAASLRSIAFDGAAGTLAIQVEAADIAGLQRVGTALNAQGLAAESGAASQDQGKAVGSFLIRGHA